jgi:hypothetical protein
LVSNLRKLVNNQREIIKVSVNKKIQQVAPLKNADLEHLESPSPSTTNILKRNQCTLKAKTMEPPNPS